MARPPLSSVHKHSTLVSPLKYQQLANISPPISGTEEVCFLSMNIPTYPQQLVYLTRFGAHYKPHRQIIGQAVSLCSYLWLLLHYPTIRIGKILNHTPLEDDTSIHAPLQKAGNTLPENTNIYTYRTHTPIYMASHTDQHNQQIQTAVVAPCCSSLADQDE